MNKVVLIGRLVAKPELKFIPGSGTAVCNFTLAVNRRFKKDGQQEADFIPVVVFGKPAEATANYMDKGSMISIAGRIQVRNYENKEGKKVYVTEVVADEVEFLSKKEQGQSNSSQQDYTDVTGEDSGEIPF